MFDGMVSKRMILLLVFVIFFIFFFRIIWVGIIFIYRWLDFVNIVLVFFYVKKVGMFMYCVYLSIIGIFKVGNEFNKSFIIMIFSYFSNNG